MTSSAQPNLALVPTSSESPSVQLPASDAQVTTAQDERLLRSHQLKNWDMRSVDIQLSAVSCVDIYRALVIQKKPMAIVPEQAAAVSEIGKQASHILISKHSDGKLALRCRKIAVETDANNTIRYRLYLAAGFAVTTAQDNSSQRAPIVLVPVRIERLRGRGSPYAIKYTGEPLRLNPHIAESCNTHVDQLIAPFESESDLRNYLRTMGRKLHSKLNCRISANTGLFTLQEGVLETIEANDQLSAELERTKPGVEFKPLPPLPDHFNATLGARILRHVDQSDLTLALESLTGHNTTPAIPDYDEPPIKGDKLDKVTTCAQWLCEIGLGNWQIKNLQTLPARVQTMIDNVQSLSVQPAFNRYFYDEHQTVGTLLNLYSSRSKITNAPPEMQHHAISLHADPQTRLLLQTAKVQATTIEQEMQVLHETFHMSAVPDSAALHTLIEVIAKREESSQLTNPQYFRARRQLNEILKTHNGLITDNDLEKLAAMANTLQCAEQFNNNGYYKRNFGSLFYGVDTNWQRLDSVINYTRSLAYNLDSADLVSRLTESWPSFQRDFSSLSELLQPAATDVHQLCNLIPLFIDNSTPLPHAIRTAEKFVDKVDTWQRYLSKHVLDLELTPDYFANGQDNDAASQEILLPQFEYDARIYQHIVSAGLDEESITATAEWLANTLNYLEIDIATVRRYLDAEAQFETNEELNAI